MAAEDWIDEYEYEPEEGDKIWNFTCKYCGKSGLRWHFELGNRWALRHENGERHRCHEYFVARNTPATADEFLRVTKDLTPVREFTWMGDTLRWSHPKIKTIPRGITGKRADFMILDDPHAEMPPHQQRLLEWAINKDIYTDNTGDPNMPTTAPKKTKRGRKTKAPSYSTIGVRYSQGGGTVYAFKVRKGAKLHLGQELIDVNNGSYSVCFVVRLDKEPQDNNAAISYRFLSHKLAPL